MVQIKGIPAKQIAYVDETGIDTSFSIPLEEQCKKHIITPLQYSKRMDSTLFKFWFQMMLLPSVIAGSVIVMDNARFDQKKILCEMAGSSGRMLCFIFALIFTRL